MLELVAEYVDKLDTAAEDRLLTTKLVPNEISAENGTAGCLVGVATGSFNDYSSKWWPEVMDSNDLSHDLFTEFNAACENDPIATADFIRNRILENRFAKLPKKELVCQ